MDAAHISLYDILSCGMDTCLMMNQNLQIKMTIKNKTCNPCQVFTDLWAPLVRLYLVFWYNQPGSEGKSPTSHSNKNLKLNCLDATVEIKYNKSSHVYYTIIMLNTYKHKKN